MPVIPGLLEQSTANPDAKPGAEISFKDFASDFMLFLKQHCKVYDALESDELSKTRSRFRKESITRAGADAPVGSQVLKVHETSSITYLDAPVTSNLSTKGVEALGYINAMRRDASGKREADWWLTFAPAPETEDGWVFVSADVQDWVPDAEPAPRERATDTTWISDVLDARKEVIVVYGVARDYHVGNDRGGGKDLVKAVAMYRRGAALPPGPGRYYEKYRDTLVDTTMYVNGSAVKCNLADMYEYGKGVEQDYQQALFWYNEAAKLNNGVAEYSLGGMFDLGRGVTRDIDAAIAWLERAHAHGCWLGDERLKQLRKEKLKNPT